MMKRFTKLLLPSMRLGLAKSDTMSLFQSHSHSRLMSSVQVSQISCYHLGHDNMFKFMQKHHSAHFSSTSNDSKENEYKNHLEVEIMSTDCIKPAVPTRKHPRMYEFSILDQILPDYYSPLVYFYVNDQKTVTDDLHDLTLKRIRLLKWSLSETLTRFYPLAGKIKYDRHIDCNDEGVYCVEANVSCSLSEFLSQPSVKPLLPCGSNPDKLFSEGYVVMIQLSTFTCGGISLGMYASHKILDGFSIATFVKAWAATTDASHEDIYPKFVTPSIFPFSPTLLESEKLVDIHVFEKPGNNVTKRFLFCDSNLTTLKRRGGEDASRIMAVTALIWKCWIKALKGKSTSNDKSSALTSLVNIQKRGLSPMPLHTIGNMLWTSRVTLCWEDERFGLDFIVKRLKNSVYKVNGDFVESVKGEAGSQKLKGYLDEVKMFYSKENTEHLMITSMCNCGMYDANFGWGKPMWIHCEEPGEHSLTNFVILMDTRSGKGIEAWVTLSNEDMTIFEQDPELLEMACAMVHNPLA